MGEAIIDLGVSPCDNSPRVLTDQVGYVCNGHQTVIDHQVYDPDGDSLRFQLVPSHKKWNIATQAFQSITYDPGYSPLQPLGPNYNVSLDSLTGELTVDPLPGASAEMGVYAIEVSSFRNGTKMSQIRLDYTLIVRACTTNAPPRMTNPRIVQGAMGDPLRGVSAVRGVPMTLEVTAVDPDVLDVLTSIIDTLNFGMGPLTYTVAGTNPQTVTLNWTPQKLGFFPFQVKTNDPNCPIHQLAQFTFPVQVVGLGITAQVTPSLCLDSTGQITLSPLGGTAPYSYLWSTGDTTPQLNNLRPGTYTVTITDANGTQFTNSFTVQGSAPDPTFTVLGQAGGVLTLQGTPGATRYLWDYGDGNRGTGFQVAHQFTRAGPYYVRLIVENPCGRDTSYQVVTNTVSLDVQEKQTSLSVFPNPMERQAKVQFANEDKTAFQLRVFHASGKLVQSYPPQRTDHIDIQKGNLVPGIYILQLTGGGHIYHQRLIVK